MSPSVRMIGAALMTALWLWGAWSTYRRGRAAAISLAKVRIMPANYWLGVGLLVFFALGTASQFVSALQDLRLQDI